MDTQTLWFDVAVIMAMFYVGTMFFGHFEEHKPKWRRLLKGAVFVIFTVLLSSLDLRWLAYTVVFGLGAFALIFVHAYWLPKHGINGLTGEPKDKYYELIKRKPTAL